MIPTVTVTFGFVKIVERNKPFVDLLSHFFLTLA